MANRHKAQGKGGREKIFGNKEVFASMTKGTKAGAIVKATGGKVVGKAVGGACAPMRMDKKARGGAAKGGGSPFSSAASSFSKGG